MSMLIITGLPGTRLSEVEASLCQIGMSRPLPMPSAPIPTVDAWIQRVVPPTWAGQGAREPSRLFDLAAGEILLANINQPLWGWADERHAALLDFWLNLDADAQFLLVFTEPARFLAERCATLDQPPDLSAELDYWQNATAHLLRFHLRNPGRCGVSLLSHWQEHPEAVRAALNGRVPVDTLTHLEPLSPTDPELLWLCKQMAARNPHAMQLWVEVEALIDVQGLTPGEAGPERAILECQRRMTRLRGQADALAHETELRLESAGRLAACEARILELTAALQVAEADARHHATVLSDVRRQARNDTDALRSRIRDMAENLDAKQREIASLENQFADWVERNSGPGDKGSTALNEPAREKNLLLAQLHQVQEELERTYLFNHTLEDEKAALLAAFRRLIRRNPEFVDFESAHIAQDAPGVLSLRFVSLRVGALLMPALDTMFAAAEAGVALVIPSGQAGVPWTGTQDDAPLIFNTTQPEDAPERVRLASLSTSAWEVVRTLPVAALVALREHAIDAPIWRESLESLRAALHSPQLLWRWDEVTLRHEQINPDYEHLWIRLIGASFGLKTWPVFEFRVAGAQMVDGAFSGHFKYEFPEQPDALRQFEHWRADVIDEQGPRFELRFDLAQGAFDTEAWERLSKSDQQQFAGLLIALPAMLAALEQQGSAISRPWRAWLELNRLAINVLLRLAQSATQYE